MGVKLMATTTETSEPTTRPRQLGRVSDEQWDLLKRAAQKSGRSFTDWSLAILTVAAKRELSRSADSVESGS